MRNLVLSQFDSDVLAKEVTEIVVKEIQLLKDHFQPKEPTEWLTRNDVKELLHINLSTVWAWTKKNKLKAYGIGNRIYYKRLEIEQAIQPINIL